ncbi:TerC family protein [Basilea psittacipulmonis]|uniref:Membrane protein n=1 Tax=Basilea psittacipulmonis DSM 24701 TaxID=1072685 RepID=A0A077DDS8_9BURK|nr:TerC family protein [Basilea psittacipulmonis]AIL32759.1 membrane protein [Basilea psittacipulmonis DSM 24701]
MEWFWHINWAIVGQIVLADIMLGGDNALIIALACRDLPKDKRNLGVIMGTVGAIAIRVILIFFFIQLVKLPFLKFIGGLLLLWIGIKLLLPHDDEHNNIESSTSVWNAVKTIIMADVVMSLDNVIAITAAAENSHADHQIFYVIFGLLVSVPIIIWGSTLVLKLIDRFKIIIIFGAGLLGWIAGSMIMNDVGISNYVLNGHQPSSLIVRIAEVTCAIFVIALGSFLARKRIKNG